MNFFYTDGYDEYARFPMHCLNVTQNYNEGGHLYHWKDTNYVDYPIDLGGMDNGRDYLYAPVNMKIVKINGIGSDSVSNKIFLESINSVYTPKFGKKKIFMTAVHFEDSDIQKFNLYEGKIIKAGQAICFEGKETATANHLHITCGLGSANKSVENNKGKWVTLGDCKKPEEIFYIDTNFTLIKNLRGINFINLPSKEMDIIEKIGVPIMRDSTKNQVEILVDNLKVRKDSNINSAVLGYVNRGIYNYTDIVINDYSWYKVDIGWIAYDEKWANKYEKDLVVVEEEKEIIVEEKVKLSFFRRLLNKIKTFFSSIFK